MTFLTPWAAWFLTGIPLIVALYFLRLKRRAITVSTHLFWQRALNQASRNAFFQRLRHLLSLLLHLVILLLLVGALARPIMDRFIHDGASVVLVLDCRARMQATSADGAMRFEKARQTARRYVREAGEQRQFAIVKMDAAASVIVPFTGDEKPLLDTLNAIQPTDVTGDIEPAIKLANTLLEARKGSHRVIMLTDREFPASPENVAITRFATRPLPANPETSEVLLEVRNFGKSIARTNVELSYDEKPLDVKSLELAPGATSLTVFPVLIKTSRLARGQLTAKLDKTDALALDNVAFATLPHARSKRILLISKGSFFLERLLEADSAVKFELLTPDAFTPALAEKFAAVIFDGAVPAGFDLAKSEGNFLFVKNTPFPAGAIIEQPLVTDVDATHPATRNVSLRNVSILRAQTLAVPSPADGWTFTAPLRSFDNALLITGQRRTQRMAALAFDVVDSDIPLRVAFPLMLSNTIHWLAGDEPEAETAPTILPAKNGFHHDGTRWLAVNTFSAAESELSTDKAAIPTLPTTPLSGLPIWQWLAIAAFTLLIGEWALHHRRRTE